MGERHETGREITSPLKVGGHRPIKELSGQHKAQFSFLDKRTLDLESDGSGFKSQLSHSLAVSLVSQTVLFGFNFLILKWKYPAPA